MARNADSFRPPAIYAGISVARLSNNGDSDGIDSVNYLKKGEASTSGFDFDTASYLSNSWTVPIFSADDSDEIAFRETLTNIISSFTPRWTRYARFGRERMLKTMSEDTAHCFTLAGLTGNDPATIDWWDRLFGDLRSHTEERNFESGRIAERKSLDLETARVKNGDLPVVWVAIDTFSAGYDIRSCRPSPQDATSRWLPHYIEVKSSKDGSGFFLTRGEWEFARRRIKSWELHLWIGEAELPCVVNLNQIKSMIPSDGANSEWKTCWIEATANLRSNLYSCEVDG
jgi:hypothetical protein